MTDNRSLLKLMPEQREDLQRWAQSRTLPAGDVFRARLILALADGSTYREVLMEKAAPFQRNQLLRALARHGTRMLIC